MEEGGGGGGKVKRIISAMVLEFFICFFFRQGISRLMWKLDKKGNLASIHEGLVYCAHCEDVKNVVETVLTKRV